MIVVVDSTDRERISVTREELYRMLAHEVSGEFEKHHTVDSIVPYSNSC